MGAGGNGLMEAATFFLLQLMQEEKQKSKEAEDAAAKQQQQQQQQQEQQQQQANAAGAKGTKKADKPKVGTTPHTANSLPSLQTCWMCHLALSFAGSRNHPGKSSTQFACSFSSLVGPAPIKVNDTAALGGTALSNCSAAPFLLCLARSKIQTLMAPSSPPLLTP